VAHLPQQNVRTPHSKLHLTHIFPAVFLTAQAAADRKELSAVWTEAGRALLKFNLSKYGQQIEHACIAYAAQKTDAKTNRKIGQLHAVV
jgi:hypothetical protein